MSERVPSTLWEQILVACILFGMLLLAAFTAEHIFLMVQAERHSPLTCAPDTVKAKGK